MVASYFQSGNGPVITALRQLSDATGVVPPKALVNWIPGTTPLSTWTEVIVAVAAYFVIIFGGREIMR
jgi:hypothetical protein